MQPMRILILGGGIFVGRALTDSLLARGHAVTHVNRGKASEPDPRVATVFADRATPALASQLAGGEWDAVLDTSGYLPQVVRRSAEALRDRAGRYLFVSSISAYERLDREGLDETAPLFPAPEVIPEALDMALYGPLKAACEAVVAETHGTRATIVRPGLIVGPHDPTDRFTYWPVRVARGGAILAPGRAARPVQFIDARDLAQWMVRLLEDDVPGTFNATGPAGTLTMGGLLEACRATIGSDARFEWLSDDRLLCAGVAPWSEMPLWIPESAAEHRGHMRLSIARAVGRGLTFRPLAATIADTLAWSRTRPADRAWKAGLAPERERALLG